MGDRMSQRSNRFCAIRARSKSDVQGKLAAGWARVMAGHKGEFIDTIDSSPATVNRALTGDSVPELHTALNSLAFDFTALDEVLALYGAKIVPNQIEASNDLATISSLSNLAGQFAKALEDGHRDHRETMALAAAIRPLMKALSAICAEADHIKGAA